MVGTIGAVIGVAAACGGVGATIDLTLSASQKRKIYSLLQAAIRRDPNANLAAVFIAVFDYLFHPSSLHRPRLMRSVAVSCSALVLISAYWHLGNYEQATRIVSSAISSSENIVILALLAILFNVFVDFISLWETRLVLERMASRRGVGRRLVWLFVDVICSLFLFIVVFYWSFFFVAFYSKWNNFFLTSLPLAIPIPPGVFPVFVFELVLGSGFKFTYTNIVTDPLLVFFYTSLFPSLWVWVFMGGTIVWSALRPLLANMGQLQQRPATCVMTAGGLLLACVLGLLELGKS